MSNIVVGLDIGTTKVTAIVGEISEDESINVIGVGITPSRGMEKGMVVNVEETTLCIQKAIEDAQRMADLPIDLVYIGVAGSHIESINNVATKQVTGDQSIVDSSDIDQLLAEVQNINVPDGKEIIHSIVRGYKLDSAPLQDPLGMKGSNLELSAHIIYGATNSIQNLITCAFNVQLSVAQVILQPLASANAVLNDDERKMGVALVDIGGGTTDIAIFKEGKLNYTKVIPVGGTHFTNDLAYFLTTGFSEAEKLKIRYGTVDPRKVDKNLVLEVSIVGGDEKRKVNADVLCEVLEPRADELVDLIIQALGEGVGDLKELSAGIVITGGGSQIRGLESMIKKKTGLSVRLGRVKSVNGLTQKVSNPMYATGVGLIHYGYHNYEKFAYDTKEGLIGRMFSTIKGWFL
ncbi:MAG: cell division protein FtsA [Candidatus Cloacimonadota bacterium]|nr:MAG: cell division protein FtsA [Candidatus Cloacimonadota bacterium]